MPSKTDTIRTDNEKHTAASPQAEKPSPESCEADLPESLPDADQQSDLNNASPTPPKDVQVRLRKAAEESDKLDSPERTNDSTIDPNKPKEDLLKGFHGG